LTSAWIDVSAPLQNGMAQWPGDAPFARIGTLAIGKGDACNLSEIRSSVHIGTHVDAPLHFIDGGESVDSMPLSAMIGPARVIAIRDSELIRIEELEAHRVRKGERVLFKTVNSERSWAMQAFQEKYVHIPESTAKYLAGLGVQTVGVDYLSVGAFDGDGAKTHRALLGAGVWIIEGLMLQAIEPGAYELICLPLKLIGSDGAPARAVVRRLENEA
jgi:arylformamidase